MTTPDEIVKYARTWLGCKWRHQGRGEGTPPSLDCAGLLILTANHFDLPAEDLVGYGRNPAQQFLNQIKAYTEPADMKGSLHGAVGIFNDNFMPCHTGIFSEDKGAPALIHAEYRPRSVCHEEFLDGKTPPLRARLIEVRRFKDVDYV